MNKAEFLNQLRGQLQGLSPDDIEDIVRDHEEMIRDAVSAGRSEESVLQSLGSPVSVAQNLKTELKIEKTEEQIKKAEEQIKNAEATINQASTSNMSQKTKAILSAVGAVLVLAPFNLIFVLGPFLALMGLLLGGWVTSLVWIALFTTLLIFFFIFFLFLPAGWVVHIGLLLGAIGAWFMGLFLLGVMYFVTRFVFELVLKYLRWNLKFIRTQSI